MVERPGVTAWQELGSLSRSPGVTVPERLSLPCSIPLPSSESQGPS